MIIIYVLNYVFKLIYLCYIIIDIIFCYFNYFSEILLNICNEMINVCFCLGGRLYVCKFFFLFGKRNLIVLIFWCYIIKNKLYSVNFYVFELIIFF